MSCVAIDSTRAWFSEKDIGSYVYFSNGPWYVQIVTWLICAIRRPLWLNHTLVYIANWLTRKTASGRAYRIVDVKNKAQIGIE